MKKTNKKLLSTITCIFLSTVIVFSNEPEKNTTKKEIEKIEVQVNDKTHVVYVNKTMINKIKNAQSSDSCLSSIILVPANASEEVFYSKDNTYILNVKKETNSNISSPSTN